MNYTKEKTEKLTKIFNQGKKNALVFLCWALIGILVGIVVGLVGTAFAYAISFATKSREAYSWLLYLLPLLGIVIVWIYNRAGMEDQPGTNMVLLSVREEKTVPFRIAPVIFSTSFLTHLGGGSAGREGAALQIGSAISQQIRHWLKADANAMHIFSMCGMSACFSCLFGTPVAATVFSMEVVSVGIMRYSALIPCAISALTADWVARCFHVHHMQFSLPALSAAFELQIGAKVLLIAFAAAIVSILFCLVLKKTAHIYEKYIVNRYIRIIIGGCLVIVFTKLLGTTDYLGAGEDVITSAIAGKANGSAFLLKILFTAITLEAGYKGGEIVPSLFIGATLGCVLSRFLGIDPGFGAAVGMIGLFCGATNCPIASLFLGLELFGGAGLEWFLLTVAISYFISGYYGLYSQQKIVYSKNDQSYLDTYTRH